MSAHPESEGFDLRDGIRSRVSLNDGTRMPVLGLGVYQSPPGPTTRAAIQTALDAGYRLVDTAALYGNEADVGQVLRDSSLPREEVFVTTKLWNRDQGNASALRAFERSRKALGLDYIDLYLIHWPVSGTRQESWAALTRIRESGACRSIGVSNYTTRHLEELLAASEITPVVNQVEFSPFLFQSDLLTYCRTHRIQLEAYAPLTRGNRLAHPPLVRVARTHDRSPAQVMLRWGLQHGVVEIPKSVHPERIRENAGLFDFELSASEMRTLDGFDEGLRVSWDPSEMT